jgi:hypothetical protein
MPVSSNFQPTITSSTSRDDVRVIMVEYNQETNQAILKVYIRMGQGYKQIKFPFDLAVDTPEAVAREMVVELNLNEMVYHNISLGIFDSLQDANLVPKPITNTPQMIPPTPLETNNAEPRTSGSAGKFTISTGFYADIDKIINPNTVPATEEVSPEVQPQQTTSANSVKPKSRPELILNLEPNTEKPLIGLPLAEEEKRDIAKFVESPKSDVGRSPHVASTLTTPQDLERHDHGTHGTPTVQGELTEHGTVVVPHPTDSHKELLVDGQNSTLEQKGKRPVQIPKQLTINIPKKENGGPVVVQDKQAPVQQITPSRLTADKEEITKEWLILLRKQKQEEQELREKHKRERDEFRRSYGITVNSTNSQPSSQQSITVPFIPATNGSTSQLESPILKAKSSPPSSVAKLKVVPSKQMKTVFEKLISDIETRIGEDFKTSKTNPNEVEKVTTTTQIVNELKRSQSNLYKITTTTMTTTSSVNSKAQQILKQQQQSKSSPVTLDTLLPVNDHDSPTSSAGTPLLITTPNGIKDVNTPSKLIRSDYNSKSTSSLNLLEALDTSLVPTPLHQSISESTPLRTVPPLLELKKVNTVPVMPSIGDELISLMTKNIDDLLQSNSNANTPRVLSPKERKNTIDES